MPKIQFATVLKDWAGDEIEEVDSKDTPAPGTARRTIKLTLGSVCVRAVNNMPTQDQRNSAPDIAAMVKRGNLIEKIYAAEKAIQPIELSPEEIVSIKQDAARFGFSPWIIKEISEMLFPPAAKDEAA